MINVVGLLFDGGLAVLLIVTIGYCARLSKRIRLLQDSRGELAGMIAQFDQATGRATASLAELQSVAKRITEALQLKIEKANFLADDLAFLIEKSSKLATQLEQAKAAQAEAVVPAAKPSASTLSFFQNPSPPKSKADFYPPPETQGTNIPSSVTSSASLEALLNRLGAPAPKAAAARPQTPQSQQALRTEAERELLEMLKSGR